MVGRGCWCKQGVALQEGSLEPKEFRSFISGGEPADLCPGGREEVEGDIISNTLGSKQACPLLQEGHYFRLPGKILQDTLDLTGV